MKLSKLIIFHFLLSNLTKGNHYHRNNIEQKQMISRIFRSYKSRINSNDFATESFHPRSSNHFRHSYARIRTISLGQGIVRARGSHPRHIYIRIYGKKSGGKIPVGQGNTWPRKRGRHELGERVGRRWSGGEEEWGSEEVPERRERRVEKRGTVAHWSLRNGRVLSPRVTRTNERTNESYSQGIVCGGGDDALWRRVQRMKEKRWYEAERSEADRGIDPWNEGVRRGSTLGIHARIYKHQHARTVSMRVRCTRM